MRKLTRSPKKNIDLPKQSFKVKFAGIQDLSYFFRSALDAYQKGAPLTYQREPNNPRKEVSFRLTEELMTFYNSLPLQSRTDILERVLGSFYYCVFK